jgi:hypothetical protein
MKKYKNNSNIYFSLFTLLKYIHFDKQIFILFVNIKKYNEIYIIKFKKLIIIKLIN